MLMMPADERNRELWQLRNEKRAIERAIHFSRMHRIGETGKILSTLKAYDRALTSIEMMIGEMEERIGKQK